VGQYPKHVKGAAVHLWYMINMTYVATSQLIILLIIIILPLASFSRSAGACACCCAGGTGAFLERWSSLLRAGTRSERAHAERVETEDGGVQQRVGVGLVVRVRRRLVMVQ
jgi:hypothetical protein